MEARAAPPLPIEQVAEQLGLGRDDLVPYGRDMAKVRIDALQRVAQPRGRLILVSAITPSDLGEGKTTVSVGLAMAMQRLGKVAVPCLREPSLGPAFGLKGGGTGGGRAQLVPAEAINLHFTGDIHAVGAAHNLLPRSSTTTSTSAEPPGSTRGARSGRASSTWATARCGTSSSASAAAAADLLARRRSAYR